MKPMRSAGILAVAVALLATGCAKNAESTNAKEGSDAPITVTIKDDACEVSTNSVPSGSVRFVLKNEGTVRNEFEILAPDKLRIVGERENLGPGTSVDYTLSLEPGNYFTACKKNMLGDLVGTAAFTVTDSGKKADVSADEAKLRDKAVTNYTAYIRDQAGQLVTATQAFVDAYKQGDTDKARALYPRARQYYERIEPTAEQFGDLDPALDLREADWQEEGEETPWTGWHAIEKDLWRPADFAGWDTQKAAELADTLNADTQKLYDYVYAADFAVTLDQISNGAIGLLEEVATSKITGEEEAFSHTDLWDFKANVEGAQVAYGNVEAIAKQKDPELAAEITDRFAELDAELAKYADGDGYVSYETLSAEQTKALSDKVNGLRTPLAKLTEALLK